MDCRVRTRRHSTSTSPTVSTRDRDRARAAGATIAQEPSDQFYGDRTYRAVDLEGHMWTFAEHVRDVTRADAEAALGQPITAPTWA